MTPPRINVRENWYRDVWLLLITGVTVLLAIIAVNAANNAQQAVKDVQAQRVESILTSCNQQNARHDHTIRQLDLVLAKAERVATPARRLQLRQSRAATVLLINQLAPKLDCQQVVLMATRTPPETSVPPIHGKFPPLLTKPRRH